MVLHKILDQYVSSYERWIKSVIRLGNNEVLETNENFNICGRQRRRQRQRQRRRRG